MQQSRPNPVAVSSTAYSGYLNRWSVSIQCRDIMATWHQATVIECADPVFFRRDIEGQPDRITEILPRPIVNRIGTKSRPFRLLSGQEIQLSEDDLRITGISKAYTPEAIGSYGTYYQIGQDLGQGAALYDLLFIDDSDPLTYSITVRKREDTRYRGYSYDQLP
jgi:hypothetical protein